MSVLTVPFIGLIRIQSDINAEELADTFGIMVSLPDNEYDENTVLATWEYNEYRFAIIGEVKEIPECIPKVALSIIYKLD